MANQSEKNKETDSEVSAPPIKKADSVPSLFSWLSRDWLFGLLLVLAVVLVYQPVWYAGFIWDDDGYVKVNTSLFGPLGLSQIWTTSAADISPLTASTFWLEHLLWGLAPLPYHLVNVLLHGTSAVLLWRVLRSMSVRGAWLGAALWAFHPVEVESVAWVSEMKNTESGLYFLLSILFFVKWLRARETDERPGSGWNYGLTLLFAALAMASKSSTVILPLVLCLCAWWVEGRWRWRNLAVVIPQLIMAMAASASSIWSVTRVAGLQSVRPWPERLVTAGDAVWFYLGKLLWPHPLATMYPSWEIHAGWWVSYLPLLAVILLLSFLWLGRNSWSRPWFFAFAYFVVGLLPVLGLVNHAILRYSPVFDHFQYLASMGPLALAGAGLVWWANKLIPGKSKLQTALFAGLLLVLGMTSWQRVWVYESQETLWSDTLAQNPNSWAAYNNLGDALMRRGQVDEAIVRYQSALEINPGLAEGHNNLGAALFKKGRVDEAIVQYQKAIAINPKYAEACYNLGDIFLQIGEVDEAIARFQKALEIKPDYAGAYYNLGNAFAQKGQMDQAMVQYQKALEINPNDAKARNNLGNALLKKGRVDEAMVQYRQALELNPDDADLHANLATVLLRFGRIDEALVEFQNAVAINPGHADAHYNLGNVFFQKSRMDEAIEQYRQALTINPNYAEAHNNLGIALYQTGQLDACIAQFKEVVRLKPDFASAKKNLAQAEELAQQKANQR